MTSPSPARVSGMPPWVPTAAAVVALVLHLLVGAFLVLPGWAVRSAAVAVVLTLVWVLGLAGLVVLWRRRSVAVLAAPALTMVAAIALLLATQGA